MQARRVRRVHRVRLNSPKVFTVSRVLSSATQIKLIEKTCFNDALVLRGPATKYKLQV